MLLILKGKSGDNDKTSVITEIIQSVFPILYPPKQPMNTAIILEIRADKIPINSEFERAFVKVKNILAQRSSPIT